MRALGFIFVTRKDSGENKQGLAVQGRERGLNAQFFTVERGSSEEREGQGKKYILHFFYKKAISWEVPGGPVVRTPLSQCQRSGFHPWLGN